MSHECRKLLADTPGTMADICQPVASQLAAVERLLDAELTSGHAPIDHVLAYLVRAGGKRLRPALVLLSARATGGLASCHIALAGVVEMIHLAALVHDDVLDEADLRHHKSTIRSQWSNETAVLTGDFIFARAFRLVNRQDSLLANRLVADAVDVVCRGELAQTLRRGDLHVCEADYLEMIAAKTAALCQLSCRLGAVFAGAGPDAADRLASYGQSLGIAFQLTDDLLDITGSEHRMGKTLGTDLRRHRPTMPLIRLVAEATEPERRDIQARLEPKDDLDVAWFRARFERSGCLAYTRQQAEHYVADAQQHLADLPPTEARDALHRLGWFVAGRAV